MGKPRRGRKRGSGVPTLEPALDGTGVTRIEGTGEAASTTDDAIDTG